MDFAVEERITVTSPRYLVGVVAAYKNNLRREKSKQ
jgi:hypothetical protein